MWTWSHFSTYKTLLTCHQIKISKKLLEQLNFFKKNREAPLEVRTRMNFWSRIAYTRSEWKTNMRWVTKTNVLSFIDWTNFPFFMTSYRHIDSTPPFDIGLTLTDRERLLSTSLSTYAGLIFKFGFNLNWVIFTVFNVLPWWPLQKHDRLWSINVCSMILISQFQNKQFIFQW